MTETDANARDGTAIMKRVVGRMGDKPDGPRMNLTVYTPGQGQRAGADAAEHHLRLRRGGRGRQCSGKTPPPSAKGRGPGGGFDSIGEVLGRGWGYASLGYTDIQPDRADRWTEGVIG